MRNSPPPKHYLGMGTYYLQIASRGRETLGWMEDYGIEFNPQGVVADTCFRMLAAETAGVTLIGHSVAPDTLEAVIASDSQSTVEALVAAYREKSSAMAQANLWKKKHVIWEVGGNAELTALLDHLGLNAAAATALS